jgi:magnesium-transporting ATPase (P-type)
VNSNANIMYSVEKKKEIRSGNQSECGLLKFVMKEGEDYEKYRMMFSDAKSIAFSSDRKRMSTYFQVQGPDCKFVRVCVKGQA